MKYALSLIPIFFLPFSGMGAETFLLKRVPGEFHDPGTARAYIKAYERFLFTGKNWSLRLLISNSTEDRDDAIELSIDQRTGRGRIRHSSAVPSVTEAVFRGLMAGRNDVPSSIAGLNVKAESSPLGTSASAALMNLWNCILPGGEPRSPKIFVMPESIVVCMLQRSNGSIEVGVVRNELHGTDLFNSFTHLTKLLSRISEEKKAGKKLEIELSKKVGEFLRMLAELNGSESATTT